MMINKYHLFTSFCSEVKKKLKEEVDRIRTTIPAFKPGLAILQVVF